MRMSHLAAANDIDLFFLHVPGETLVAEDLDAASRHLAELERGPACTPELRTLVHAAARRQGCTLSVDLYTCSENSVCPRSFSRYPDAAAAAATDALSAPKWNSSCPACGFAHWEASFAFPLP